MNLLKSGVKKLIEKKDYKGLNQLLLEKPNLANAGITIPYDFFCTAKAHPLHRICDGVFSGKITENESIKLADILLQNGANIDGDKNKNEGTPLLAAASLHAEQLGIFYIENGADIHYTFQNNGESALHWASYCGMDKLVDRLIKANSSIDKLDNTYKSTPLGWAIHSMQSNNKENKKNHIMCIKLLLKNGADLINLDSEKKEFLLSLVKTDQELKKMLD